MHAIPTRWGLRPVSKAARVGEGARLVADLESVGVPTVGRLVGDATADAGDMFWLDDDTVAIGRSYRTNEEAVERAVVASPAFVGLVASRRRGEAVLGYLAERGVPRDALDRLDRPRASAQQPRSVNAAATAAARFAMACDGDCCGGCGTTLGTGAPTATSWISNPIELIRKTVFESTLPNWNFPVASVVVPLAEFPFTEIETPGTPSPFWSFTDPVMDLD